MPKLQEAPEAVEPKARKSAPPPPPPPEPEYVTSAQLAAEIGIKPTMLRRWLRTLPEFQDNSYTRYKWELDDPFLSTAKSHYEQFAKDEEARLEKRAEETRLKAEKKKLAAENKPVKKGKAAVAAAAEEEEEEEVFEEDEEAEETEETEEELE